MKHCEACQREFRAAARVHTCPYCGFNTHPRGQMPRSKASLERIEQRRKRREQELEDYREYYGDENE